jgi:hypothetical protein
MAAQVYLGCQCVLRSVLVSLQLCLRCCCVLCAVLLLLLLLLCCCCCSISCTVRDRKHTTPGSPNVSGCSAGPHLVLQPHTCIS